MARRKLETPSADDLKKLETEFRSETATRSAMAPIAQVASETASGAPVLNADLRRKLASAEAFVAADAEGRVMQDVPVAEIAADAVTRDRVDVPEAELEELCTSIERHGVRLPVELHDLGEAAGSARYALVSGYRRLLAVRRLLARTGNPRFQTIRAILRTPQGTAQALVSMVEENEIRADLSHYERGRIAAISAHNGVFASVEAAVDALFFAASKAKRSKVRSFAQVFEHLGDLLNHPEALTERQGLRVAAALRAGQVGALRAALARDAPVDARAEWAVLDAAMAAAVPVEEDLSRGGRPKSADRIPDLQGITFERVEDADGFAIRIHGTDVDADVVDKMIERLKKALR